MRDTEALLVTVHCLQLIRLSSLRADNAAINRDLPALKEINCALRTHSFVSANDGEL